MRFKEKQASVEAESWVKWWEMIGCTGAERNSAVNPSRMGGWRR